MITCKFCNTSIKGYRYGDPETPEVEDIECPSCGETDYYYAAVIENEEDEQKCRVCGCTWFNACPGSCYWVEEDLCSSCSI